MRRQPVIEQLLGVEEVRQVGAAVATRSTRRGSPPRPAAASSRCWALAMLSRPPRTNSWPLRALRVGITQSNMSTPGADRRPDVLGRAHAHQVARRVGRHLRRRPRRSPRASPRAPRRRRGRPAPARRTAARAISARCARRRSRCTPPCTMPKRSCPGAAGAATQRRAQRRGARHRRLDHVARRVRGRALVERHRDVAAEQPPGSPSRARASAAAREPSRCERNVTPSSSMVRRSRRLNTWKPPESVRMRAAASP